MQVATIGIDISKHVFQVHGVSAAGEVVIQKRLRRAELLSFFEKLEPCLIGIEACGTSHHWARQLTCLGHEVKLMPPSYVKPYVRRNKNDAADAEAICEAVARPTMRFVPIKTVEQQGVLIIHRVRSVLIRQRTMMANALRGHLAEFGIVDRQGLKAVRELGRMIDDIRQPLPDTVRYALRALIAQLDEVKRESGKSRGSFWRGTEQMRRAGVSLPYLG